MTFDSKEQNTAVNLNVISKYFYYILSLYIAKEEKYDQNSSSLGKQANSADNLVWQIQQWKCKKAGIPPTC